MKNIRNWNISGFTLIELLVTLAILGVLTCMTIPIAEVAHQRNQEQELHSALKEIRHALDAYQRASNDGRIAKPIGSSGYPKTLDVLVDGVPDQRNPNQNKIFFIRRIPRDPMNPNLNVSESDSWGLRSYASDSTDPRSGDDVYDVYSTSTNLGLNGVPYNKW